MNKLLIGTIVVLMLLALLPIKSEPFSFTNMEQVAATLTDDSEDFQTLTFPLTPLNQDVDTDADENLSQMDPFEMTLAENMEADYESSETMAEQETEDSDRGIFISIGSIILFGILLLLPLHLQKL